MNKRIVLFITCVLVFCSLSYADYWNANAIKMGNFGVHIEVRMDADMYYKHVHFDWHYKLGRDWTLTLSERESYIKKTEWKVEHKPMLNLTYVNGIFKNRARVTLRIKEGQDIWRIRNKVTLARAFWFVAFESFYEKGRLFRNRYYIGVNVSKSFSVFILRQHTNNKGLWVIGTTLTARI